MAENWQFSGVSAPAPAVPEKVPSSGGWSFTGSDQAPQTKTRGGGVTQYDYHDPLGQQWREQYPDFIDEVKGGWDQLKEGFADSVKAGVWTKSVAAFDVVAGAARIATAPITGEIKAWVADPFERATGWKGSSDIINTTAQVAAGFYSPVARVIDTLIDTAGDLKAADQVRKALAPTSRGVFAARGERDLRALSSFIAHDKVMVDTELARYERVIGGLNESARLDFIHRFETGQGQLTPGLQDAADHIKALLDRRWSRINSLGKGHLDSYIPNYFPHIWKDPELAQAAQQQISQAQIAELRAAAKRPLKGDQSFRKQRKFPTVADGMAWTGPNGEKLELVTDNPLRLAAMRIQHMDRYYYAQRMIDGLKRDGLLQFVRVGSKGAPGWTRIKDDPAFRVFLPPAVAEHFTAFDPEIRSGLEAVAQHLGIDIKTPLTDPIIKGGTYGYTGRHLQEVVARFGGDEAILMHEIGHQLDFKFRLSQYFGRSALAWHELKNLALKRSPGATDPAYLAYLIHPTERIANLFHAFWHSPEMLRREAPTAAKMLDDFLARHPDLKTTTDLVKPSVQLHGETKLEKFFGLRYAGDWYAPEQLATLITNYLSQGFDLKQGLGYAMRAAGNALNQAQLGFSGFHLMFTTNDAMFSRMALGFQQLTRLDPMGLVTIATAPLGPVRNLVKGGHLREAYRNPLGVPPNHEMADVLDMLIKGGGRVEMDQIHQILNGQPVWRRIVNGTLMSDLKDAFRKNPMQGVFHGAGLLLRGLFETTTEPIMSWWVPRQKLGVFYDMAKDFARANPNASELERRVAAIRMWDSVDNRLGQMVYDNLFWNKTGKDVAFLAVRSVGWNLGTFRELGGAVFDAAGNLRRLHRGEIGRLELTPRMAYAAAMTIGTAVEGAILTYLYTGKGPSELKDYFFPPTGKLTKTGAKERISIPGYLKDVVAFNQNVKQTLTNKVNPWLTLLGQWLWMNQDYYGAAITDPNDPTEKQLWDTMRFAMRTATPFSWQSMMKLEQSGTPSLPALASSFFGFQAAPGYIVDPAATAAAERRAMLPALRKKAREEAQGQGSQPARAATTGGWRFSP